MVAEWIMRFVRLVLSLMLLGGIREYGGDWNLFVLLVVLLLFTFLVTLGHELGHAAAVWLQRGTVNTIGVCGLTYNPKSASSLAMPKATGGGDLLGFVICQPPEEDWTRRQYAVLAAGGPLADIVLGMAALLLVALSPVLMPVPEREAPKAVAIDETAPPPVYAPFNLPSDAEVERMLVERRAEERWRHLSKSTRQAAALLALLAFASALFNLLPYRGSDGAQLLELWLGRNRFAKTRRPGQRPR